MKIDQFLQIHALISSVSTRASVLSRRLHLFLALGVAASPAFAAQQPRGDSDLIRSLMILALLVACAAAIWVVLRKRRELIGGEKESAKMKIVGVLALGPREKVVLLSVKDQTMLLGVTAHEVRLLSTLDSAPDKGLASPAQNATASEITATASSAARD